MPCVLDRDAQSNAPLLRPRTGSRLSTTSTLIQPLYNRFPTPHQPSGISTRPQPTFNRHATASQSQPRRNRSPITFQPPEADKRTIPRLANIHDSTTLRVESKNYTISTQPSPSCPKGAQQASPYALRSRVVHNPSIGSATGIVANLGGNYTEWRHLYSSRLHLHRIKSFIPPCDAILGKTRWRIANCPQVICCRIYNISYAY